MSYHKEVFFMSKINKILVPVDGSDNACKAVDQAISLAEKAGASLEFVYVSSHINEHIPSDIIFDRIWEKLPKDIREQMYPQDVDGTYCMANRDAHTAYIGEIVAAYMIR